MTKNTTLDELKNKASGNFKKAKPSDKIGSILVLEDQISKLQEQLDLANKQLEDQLGVSSKWEYIAKKATADLQNVMNQHNIDLANKTKAGKKSIATSVLPFLNTLRLAFTYLPSDLDPKADKFVNTLRSAFEKVVNDLATQNVVIISPKIGDDFDSTNMSAISSTNDDHKITQLVELGLIIDGQIFKPAMVMC